ncbi:hypothetical protein, partial [Allokutzneria sp. NRRL B-24872]|uniref:hypothetical protein n=1 Tax=Allokutzneria sp. NRRL B-24872 TaxID=1137961 RepID=UPI00143DCAAF
SWRRLLQRVPAEHRTRSAGATGTSGVRALLDRALAGRTRLRRAVLLRHALVRGGRVAVPRALRLAGWLSLARSRLLSVPGWPLVRPVLRPGVLLRPLILLLAGVLRRSLLVWRLLRWPRRTLGVAGLGVRLLWLVHRAPPPVGADA